MTNAGSLLDAVQLERIVQGVDPSAWLVPRRVLRRVIRRHFDLASGQHPHEMFFEVPREELLAIVPSEQEHADKLPEHVLLLPLPDDDDASNEEILVDLWRRLFHARIDRTFEQKGGDFAVAGLLRNPRLLSPAAGVAEQTCYDNAEFGPDRAPFSATFLHEIRAVLEGEDRLPPPADDHILFREFASLLLELKFFFPDRIEAYFPGLVDPQALTDELSAWLDAGKIFEATRPAGVAPASAAHPPEAVPEPPGPVLHNPRTLAQAERAAERGDDVQAAVQYRRLNDVVNAEACLRRLVERLKAPLDLDNAAADEWHEALCPLLQPATRGFWPVSGRLLYQLQKACLDVERKVYAIDVIEPLVTLGRQPLKRLLDKPRELNILRRLRTALKLSQRVAATTEQRRRLELLCHGAVGEGEDRVRLNNRPILEETLREVGLVAGNQAERIARVKVIEELLDVLSLRGFLNMSDLRDAIARNRLKLDDLAGPIELLHGDALIRANRELAVRLDGVYRRGEVYLRGLQRGSSLAFGTHVGRALMMFVVLPFGGSYVLLEGARHFIKAIIDLSLFAARKIVGARPEFAPMPPHSHPAAWMTTPIAIALIGLFLFGLIHLPVFRREVGQLALSVLGLPAAIFRSSFVRFLLNNVMTRLIGRYLLTASLVGSVAALAMRFLHFDWESTGMVSAGAALLTGTLFRTPWGVGLEERFDETLARVWRIISVNFSVGLLTLILHFFTAIVEIVEKGIYAVDAWLRFHEGEGPITFVFKLVFGTIWFFVAYAFKFVWSLLVEPQINPIKHFPVVTVSHKLLLPMIPSVASAFNMSIGTITTIFIFIPGIFGFLVWEFKENWKLYKANSPRAIRPAPVGPHGERVRGLLRPGFHSGVVPKTFAKLRRAQAAGNAGRAAKLHHRLEHIAEAVHHLAMRGLVAYLKASRRWDGLPIHVAGIRLATNRLRIPLTIRGWEGAVMISIEERGGWLIGSIEERGWLDQLCDKQRAAFADVLTALYMQAGVDVLREQASAVLGIESYRLDCRPEGLMILQRGDEPAVTIDYADDPILHASGPIDGRALHPIPVAELILSKRPIEWKHWVERWEQDHAGKAPLEPLAGNYRVM